MRLPSVGLPGVPFKPEKGGRKRRPKKVKRRPKKVQGARTGQGSDRGWRSGLRRASFPTSSSGWGGCELADPPSEQRHSLLLDCMDRDRSLPGGSATFQGKWQTPARPFAGPAGRVLAAPLANKGDELPCRGNRALLAPPGTWNRARERSPRPPANCQHVPSRFLNKDTAAAGPAENPPRGSGKTRIPARLPTSRDWSACGPRQGSSSSTGRLPDTSPGALSPLPLSD